MALQAQIHVGNTPIFKSTIKANDVLVDISATTVKEFQFRRPNGTQFVRSASFVTDGADGQLQYPAVAADLNFAGDWLVQTYVKWSDGDNKHGLVHSFKVFSRAIDPL